MKWRSSLLTPQQCQDWILVLKDLLARKPDVGVVTWVLFKRSPDESYTVSETIETAFGERYPEDTKVLLRMVKDLAEEQGCALYSAETLATMNEGVIEAMEDVKDMNLGADLNVPFEDGDGPGQLGNMTIEHGMGTSSSLMM